MVSWLNQDLRAGATGFLCEPLTRRVFKNGFLTQSGFSQVNRNQQDQQFNMLVLLLPAQCHEYYGIL